ncbi:hypothetical protein EJ03DRAFT_111360 [Teratosphaeria nubilosa]|uniref:Uncharacterized protein n=1 Tax=Teratosphaeria nubilosa TaxID=161662 RepID=A0A6G1L7Y2_9PEZI|nr:hypothetical protein EJ03DRAFT_111360 [Teratosphaeria nubilosa]
MRHPNRVSCTTERPVVGCTPTRNLKSLWSFHTPCQRFPAESPVDLAHAHCCEPTYFKLAVARLNQLLRAASRTCFGCCGDHFANEIENVVMCTSKMRATRQSWSTSGLDLWVSSFFEKGANQTFAQSDPFPDRCSAEPFSGGLQIRDSLQRLKPDGSERQAFQIRSLDVSMQVALCARPMSESVAFG